MIMTELDAPPNCGNADIRCYSNDADIVKNEIENYCSACGETFALEAAVYG